MPSSIRFLHVDKPDFGELVSEFLLRMCESIEVEVETDVNEIRVGETGGGFYYEDDGPGIPEDEREKVFKPGYSTKTEEDGAGMGMASVRQIVLAHDWGITVEDAEELEGARFEVRT